MTTRTIRRRKSTARPSHGRANEAQGRAASRLTRDLREELVKGLAPLANGITRVDRTKQGLIIIRGVKVVGKSSPNRHGLQVEGTDYEPAALTQALPLYENLKVNVDHPPREKPNADRSAEDRLGKIVTPRILEGEMYGDLEMLASHPMAERLANAAEAMPDAFALSHNARGIGQVRDGRYVISEIPEVRSVDVVADGGTCTSLFESKDKSMKLTLRKLMESKVKDAKIRKSLLEMGEAYAPEAMDAVPADDGAGEESDDHTDDLVAAVAKLVKSDDPADHEMANKIMKLIKDSNVEEVQEDTEPGMDVKEDDGDDDKEEDVEESYPDGSNKTGQRKAMFAKDPKSHKNLNESLQNELKSLKDDLAVRDLCESLQYQPTPTQRKALLALGNEKDRKAMIQELKGSRSSAPRSSSPGSVSIRESKEAPAKDAADLVAKLLR